MEGYPIDPLDQALTNNPLHYGIIHGDVNLSNFFYEEEKTTLWVFDWDQIDRSWFLYDVAQSIVGPVMQSMAGSMFDGKKLEINLKDMSEWMIGGYESTCENGKVDREALKRMVRLRLAFYETFCRRAVVEIAGDEELKFMFKFCEHIITWADSNPAPNLDFLLQ